MHLYRKDVAIPLLVNFVFELVIFIVITKA